MGECGNVIFSSLNRLAFAALACDCELKPGKCPHQFWRVLCFGMRGEGTTPGHPDGEFCGQPSAHPQYSLFPSLISIYRSSAVTLQQSLLTGSVGVCIICGEGACEHLKLLHGRRSNAVIANGIAVMAQSRRVLSPAHS